MRSRTPRILRIQAEALHILRETAVARRRARTGCTVRDRQGRRGRTVEIYGELLRVGPAGGVDDVITQLILFLIPLHRKSRNRRDKLVIAKGLKAGDRLRRGTERERQGKSKIRVARLRQPQTTRPESERSHPCRAEDELLAQRQVHIVGTRSCPSGGQQFIFSPAWVGSFTFG